MAIGSKAQSRAVLTLGMIRAVTVALQTRSMTEAALVLGISQSAVTQYVNKFEMITGMRIMNRVGNNLFVEREDIAELMEKITDLSQQMERLVQARAPKTTLALPFSIAALVTVHPALAGWIAERFHCETMTFKELIRQSGRNSFDLIIRPLRERESDIDHQFSCKFQMLAPPPRADQSLLPVLLPGGDCPTHSAAVAFLRNHRMDYQEIGRSEDIAYRAMSVATGLCATLLPLGYADHNAQYHNFADCQRLGDPLDVMFGVVARKRSDEKSNAMAFLDQFCGQLLDHGVLNGA